MRDHKSNTQNERCLSSPRGLYVSKVGLVLWLFLWTGLMAKGPAGTVAGTVKTNEGRPISRATVIAKNSDGAVLVTVRTNDRGRFQFLPIRPGVCRVEVRCAVCRESPARTIQVKGGDSLDLNFVVYPIRKAASAHYGSLGPVGFDTNSDFKRGELKNPSIGGGYSDSASAQTGRMLSQYLAPPESLAAAKASGARGGQDTGVSERDFESSGNALLARQDFERSTTLFEKAVIRYPGSERLHMGLGLSFYGAGKYEAAIRAFCQAARIAPDDPSPGLLLAEALQSAPSPHPAAAGLLKRFSDLHPQSVAGHYSYGLYLWSSYRSRHDQETLVRAKSEFERAVALDPNDAAAHLQLGIIYDQQRATVRAIHEYIEAIRVNPELATAHYRLAQDYMRAGERDKAAAESARYEKLRKAASP